MCWTLEMEKLFIDAGWSPLLDESGRTVGFSMTSRDGLPVTQMLRDLGIPFRVITTD